MFSELAQRKVESHVVKAAGQVDRRVTELKVLKLGEAPMLHVDIGGKELLPLALMGDGFERLIGILTVIFATRGGVVLIDEIENGLHYTAQRELWRAIRDATQEAGVQVFATTHSYECIRIAHEVFAEQDPYRLRLHRLDSDEQNGAKAVTYDRDALEASIDLAWEVR